MITDQTFILSPAVSRAGWVLNDNMNIAFSGPTGSIAVTDMTERDNTASLRNTGFPLSQPLDMSLRQAAQMAATALNCSPRLRQGQTVYDIGDTGYRVYRSSWLGNQWYLTAPASDSRITIVMNRRLNRHQRRDTMHFETRQAAMHWFIKHYTIVINREQAKSRLTQWSPLR